MVCCLAKCQIYVASSCAVKSGFLRCQGPGDFRCCKTAAGEDSLHETAVRSTGRGILPHA